MFEELGKYGALLIDPPWSFKTYSGPKVAQRAAKAHYNVMDIQDLCRMPVKTLAAPDCCLFLWVVDSHLDQGITMAKYWGFQYKTIVFIWDKGRMGMGHWSRKMGEVCLLFTCGKPSRNSKGVRQMIRAPRREHSRKPDEQYERIEALVKGPYCELFARQHRPGWDSWGMENDKFDTK